MSKRFNPYHAWLGIPAEEQPPNHYRLLGIPLFESSEEVIQNGLDQRMAHVKSFATGPRSAESQRLLTELSQAGICLLRVEKKQVYDQQLKSKLLATAVTAEVRLDPMLPPVAPPVAAAPSNLCISPRQTVSAGAATASTVTVDVSASDHLGQSSNASFPIVPTVVGAAIGLSLAFLVLFMLPPGKKSSATVIPTRSDKQTSEGAVQTLAGSDDNAALKPIFAPATGGTNGTGPDSPSQSATGPPQASTLPGPPPTSAGSQSPGPQPSSNPPTPLTGSLPATGAPAASQSTEPSSDAGDPSTVPGTTPSEMFTGTPKSIVLDLERPSTYVTLAENAEGQKVRAQLRSIGSLTTSYDLQPDDGIISLGQPVDIVLTEYAGVKVRLTLRMRAKNADLEIAPEIEMGRGKTSELSKGTLERLNGSTRKDASGLSARLGVAQRDAIMLQNAMLQPAPAPTRAAQTQRLGVLMNQTIPSLQRELADAQGRMGLIQKLSVLVEQLHKKASLELAVQVEPAGKVK